MILDASERDSLDFLRTVFEKANDMITVVDPATLHYVDANEIAERMLGYTREELRGMTVHDMHPESDIRRVEEIRAILDRDGRLRVTLSYRRKDGAVFPVEMSLSRIRVGGRLLTLNIARDITDRVRDMEHMRAQASELADAKGFLEALQERATDGISLTDEKGVILYINARQAAINRRPREDVIGHHVLEFGVPEHRELHAERFRRVMEDGEEVTDRIDITNPTGANICMEASSVRVEWGGRRYCFTLIRDVTEQVRQATELAEAKGFLEAVQEHAQDALYLIDDAGRMIFLNAKAEALMGRSRATVLGRHFNELSPPELKKARQEQFDRILAGENVRQRERMHRPDGVRLAVDIVSSRVQWSGRNYVFSVVRDVTEAVGAEAAVRESHERMARQQAALVAVTHSEVFHIGDLTAAVRYISEVATEALDVRRASVWRYIRDGRAIRTIDFFDRETGLHASGSELAADRYPGYFHALEETEVIAADDARRDPRTREFTDDYLVPAGITSMMDAPIHLRGALDGVLCCEHVGPMRAWAPDEKTFAVAMAHLASMVLARWDRQRLERRLEAQNATARVLADSTSAATAAPGVLRAIGSGLDWDAGLLWMVESGELRCLEAWIRPGVSLEPFIAHSRARTFAPGIGLPGRVWSTRAPAWISDVVRDPNFPRAPVADAVGLHGAVGFPILLGGDVHGVIEFLSREVREPDQDLLALMGSIGSQVGQFLERQRAEGALRESKSILETQSEASIDGILLVGPDGRIVSFNRRFRDLWNLTPEVLATRSDDAAIASVLSQLVDPDGFLARVRHLYEHAEQTSRDVLLLRDGRVFDRYSTPVRGAEGTYYGRAWFFRDVTDQKRAEDQLRRAADETRRAYDELKKAQAQLVQSEKLASVGMLVSGVAHEINNPINVIYGNLRLLKDRLSKPPVVRQMIRDALRAADEARDVIEVFRNFARDARSAEPADVNRCVRETLVVARRWLKNIRVRRDFGKLPLVPCFPGQLNQVLLNLVKNAAEAMKAKGELRIRTFRRGRRAVLEVSDSGPGIPRDLRSKIFDAFFSTKDEGMGLGLSISASIIEHHGGKLSLVRSSSRGTTFRVELPLK